MNNSIGWVQFKLLGGVRNTSITAIAYGAFVIGLMFLATQLGYQPSIRALAGGVPLFTGIQFIILLLYGTLRVGHAVRVDVNGGMLESHRLMPVSPISAVLGYTFGSTSQALSLFAINILLGAVCVSAANVPVKLWLLANGVLLLYAIMTWTIVAFFSFRFGGAAISLVVTQLILLPASAGPQTPVHMVPGLAMLVTPTMGFSVFSLGSLGTIEPTLILGALVQILMTGIYIIAGARRFTRDAVVTFDSTLSMLLLLLWMGASLAGAAYLGIDIWGNRFSYGQDEAYFLFICGLVSGALIAILPVSGAVRMRRIPPIFVALLSTAIASLMLTMAPHMPAHRWERIAISVACIAAFLFAVRYMLGLAINCRWWTKPVVALWIFMFWVLPSIIDAIVESQTPYDQRFEARAWTWNHVVSLPGLLHYCWYARTDFDPTHARTGALVQAGLVILAAVCFYMLRPPLQKKAPAMEISPQSVPAPANLLAN